TIEAGDLIARVLSDALDAQVAVTVLPELDEEGAARLVAALGGCQPVTTDALLARPAALPHNAGHTAVHVVARLPADAARDGVASTRTAFSESDRAMLDALMPFVATAAAHVLANKGRDKALEQAEALLRLLRCSVTGAPLDRQFRLALALAAALTSAERSQLFVAH
ncbi:MAG: hypothetical protein ACK40Z_15215, partial [Dietzia sp.]